MADETLDHEDIDQEARSDSRELTVEDVLTQDPAPVAERRAGWAFGR